MATPFTGKTFTFTQPDGSTVEVRGWGDQHYAVFETLDGYTLMKNPRTGFFEVAQLSSDGTSLEPAPGPPGNLDGDRLPVQRGLRITRDAARAQGLEGALRLGGRRCDQRREERKTFARMARMMPGAVFAPPKRETVGDFVGLCLLIDFPDESGAISRDEVERFCNETGYSGFGNNGSVSDYFFDNSIGRCRYTNIVADYYRAQHPKSFYTDPNIQQGVRARQLIVEALTHLKNQSFDFTSLTADNEGFVYAMNVYYAGDVVNNWAEGLWPHAWHLATPIELAPGIAAFDYQFTDMSRELSLGTFCHENGHMLCDYPDLYDYGSESSGVGAYCLMCAGGNINEKNPVHISAYLKRLSGWANSVTTIKHDEDIELAAGTNDFALHAKSSGEYFIVENRQKAGRDVALPDEGLAFWHVDEEGSNNNEQMTPSQHYELSLEQANGQFRFERSRGLYGDSTDLYGRVNKRFADSTSPSSRWWDGTASNLDVFEISDPGSTVRFRTKLFDDGSVVRPIVRESSPGLSIPDNTGAGISDKITVDQDAVIAGVKVMLDITHTYRGDLRVTLVTPWGEEIRLHERHQGGSSDHILETIDESDLQVLATLHGRSVKGDWGLIVQDLAPADIGVLNRWGLEFATSESSQGQIVLEESPGTHIPDNDPVGIQRNLSTSSQGQVANVEVSVNITHTYIGDLRVSLLSPDGTEVPLRSQSGGSGDNVIETYTTATTPTLGDLAGQSINGTWALKVSDNVGQDVGKLNNWQVVIQPVS
ncbi:MAG: M6 family metalloprotease domain-containing protein [Nitrospirales bacterium]|nr:M6 family metalloprotease domain-containing protein [Nitrospira sp.]MDR4500918.1 M6 family metalloprotease domain-containing protein [Nitrospirales bacterium]